MAKLKFGLLVVSYCRESSIVLFYFDDYLFDTVNDQADQFRVMFEIRANLNSFDQHIQHSNSTMSSSQIIYPLKFNFEIRLLMVLLCEAYHLTDR